MDKKSGTRANVEMERQPEKKKVRKERFCLMDGKGGGVEVALASYLSIHGRVSRHQIGYFNLTGTHGPHRIPILFHWTGLVFSNKPSDRFGHILCEF